MQPVNEHGQTGGKQCDPQPRYMLAQSQINCQKRHQQTQKHSDPGAGQHAQPEGARCKGDQESRHGAHQHDALYTQIQHPGSLGKNFTEGGEYNRCGHSHRGADETGYKSNIENLTHYFLIIFMLYSVNSRKISMTISDIPWITSAI